MWPKVCGDLKVVHWNDDYEHRNQEVLNVMNLAVVFDLQSIHTVSLHNHSDFLLSLPVARKTQRPLSSNKSVDMDVPEL